MCMMQGDQAPRHERMGNVVQVRQTLAQIVRRQAYQGNAGNQCPKGLLHVVRGDQQALCLGDHDASHGDKLKNGATMTVHGGSYRIRTRTLLPSELTRTSVPGSAHEMAQKAAMARKKLIRPSQHVIKKNISRRRESSISGIQSRNSGSQS